MYVNRWNGKCEHYDFASYNKLVKDITNGKFEAMENRIESLASSMKEALFQSKLTLRQITIILMAYGLTGNEPMTLADIARRFNTSRTTVWRDRKDAFRTLRHPSVMHNTYYMEIKRVAD